MEPEETEEEETQSKSQLVPTIIAFVVITAVAAGAGWFLGGDFSTRGLPEEKVASVIVKKADVMVEESSGSEEGEDSEAAISHSGPTVALLNPIVSSLSDPNGIWIRLEIAVIFGKGKQYDGEIDKVSLQNDIVAYLRTIDSELISGPSGFVHFHEDLVDRVRMTTAGRADDVKILSLVAE